MLLMLTHQQLVTWSHMMRLCKKLLRTYQCDKRVTHTLKLILLLLNGECHIGSVLV